MKRKDIYSGSYTPAVPTEDKKHILEALEVRKADRERIKTLGRMLKEERSQAQTMRQRIIRLEEENRRLKEVLSKSHR